MQVGVYLNPGYDLFKRAVNSKIYVDKTELIKYTNEAIGTEQCYICISRPRRFGKSMAANMLCAYYEKEWNASDLFDRYRIAEDKSYKEHLNQYNVIMLNVQSFVSLCSDVNETLSLLQSEVLDDLRDCYPDMITERTRFLSMALEKIYSKTRKPFIFIIDEWDCILRDKKYSEEDQKKYLDFIRNLFKDKSYVGLVYMTGILPIKKYGTHSALNMFMEYSMTEPRQFEEFVGFTEREVRELCEQYQRDYDEMERWYDGYRFPRVRHMYNPKSVVEAVLSEKCSNYWTQTETFEALKIYIEMNYDGLRESVIQMLSGEHFAVNTRSFQNDMMTFGNKDDVLTLLVHLGYLAYDQDKKEVFIPNKEIQDEFETAVRSCRWQEVINALENSEKILRATWSMDSEKVAGMVSQIHSENTSILTYNNENSLSCVIALAYYSAQNEYIRVREMPSGEGYALVFIPRKRSDKPALVMELKYDKSAEGAIGQIKKRKYTQALSEYKGNMLLVGINYNKETKLHECVIEKYEKE